MPSLSARVAASLVALGLSLVFFLPSSGQQIALQLPMSGSVEVTGNLPGDGDHGVDSRDEYALDLISDDLGIRAVASGTVTYAGWNCQRADPATQLTCYGYTVAVDHGGGLYSIYTHMSCEGLIGATEEFCARRHTASDRNAEILGARRMFVGQGDLLGSMSYSGCFGHCGNPGDHLHFAVHSGRAGLVGNLAFFDGSLGSVNVWDPGSAFYIEGLPWPPAHGLISPVPIVQPGPGVPGGPSGIAETQLPPGLSPEQLASNIPGRHEPPGGTCGGGVVRVYRPIKTQSGEYAIFLHNVSDGPISLLGWGLSVGAGIGPVGFLRFPDDFSIAPRSFVRVYVGPGRESRGDVFSDNYPPGRLMPWQLTEDDVVYVGERENACAAVRAV